MKYPINDIKLNKAKISKIIRQLFVFLKIIGDKIAINKIPNEHINEK